MWRTTIITNAALMGLFWLASILSVSVVYNRFVLCLGRGTENVFPLPTAIALSFQYRIGILPLVWLGLSYMIWQKAKLMQPESRSEILFAFSMSTLTIGFMMFLYFALPALLPLHYIGASLL